MCIHPKTYLTLLRRSCSVELADLTESDEPDVLHQLEECVESIDDNAVLTHEIALEYLTGGEFKQTEARQQIRQLLLKGYLYEIDDEIRIPPRPYE